MEVKAVSLEFAHHLSFKVCGLGAQKIFELFVKRTDLHEPGYFILKCHEAPSKAYYYKGGEGL